MRFPDGYKDRVGTTRVRVVDRCRVTPNDRKLEFGKRQVPKLIGFGFTNSRTPIHRGRTGVKRSTLAGGQCQEAPSGIGSRGSMRTVDHDSASVDFLMGKFSIKARNPDEI
jgi:hypothetical protein